MTDQPEPIEHSEHARHLRSDLTLVEVDGCISVYSPVTKRVLSLNQTATDIWRLFALDRDVDDIVGELAAVYDVDPASIRGDVENTLAQFEAEGVMESAGGEASARLTKPT